MTTVPPLSWTTALSALALVFTACHSPDPNDVEDSDVETDTDVAADTDVATDTDADTDVAVDTDLAADTDDPTPDCTTGCSVGTFDVDLNPLTGTCGCEYVCTVLSGSDAYDAAFEDSNCDGGDGVVDACVYVSASLGSDTAAGTRTDPRKTLGAAIHLAELNAVPFVCVSGEIYVETLNVPGGVTLVGSFDHLDPDFPFRRKAGVTTTVNGGVLP